MYAKDIKEGMKVVPVIKTIDGPLGKSKEWAAAQEKKQDFLYVVKVVVPAGKKPTIVCSATKGAQGGDKFATIDLRSMDWGGWDSRKPGAVHEPKADGKASKPAAKAAAKVATKAPAKATAKTTKKGPVMTKGPVPTLNGKPAKVIKNPKAPAKKAPKPEAVEAEKPATSGELFPA